jgi:plasmid replication initiation protein
MASMEHPIFSLATKPDRRVFRYEHNGNKLEIVPSVKGLATIHDKDILIYCISQLIGKMNQGERPSRTLHLTARDLLVWTNRQTDGDGYDRLRSAFERLSGTRITTNIKADGEEITEGSASSTNGGSCGKPAPAKCRKSRSRSPIGCSRWSRGAVS